MIELNESTQKDFLNKEWVQKLLDAGVDMSDAKYCIVLSNTVGVADYICSKENNIAPCLPTYTVSNLLEKLHGYLVNEARIDEVGVIEIFQNCAYISLLNENNKRTMEHFLNSDSYIESLAALLIQYHRKNAKNEIND